MHIGRENWSPGKPPSRMRAALLWTRPARVITSKWESLEFRFAFLKFSHSRKKQEGFAQNCAAHHSTKVSLLQSTISSCRSGLDLPNGGMQPKGETFAKHSMHSKMVKDRRTILKMLKVLENHCMNIYIYTRYNIHIYIYICLLYYRCHFSRYSFF